MNYTQEQIDRGDYLHDERRDQKLEKSLELNKGKGTTYQIIRFRWGGRPKARQAGLTLEQAQAHCQRDDTSGDGWFDGYQAEQLNQ
tara:strand:+ start:4713 stop:4970 length:258 start_codon:yes stop_codon:yes gene_type:complete